VPIGSVLGLVGFIALGVEALRVAVGDATLEGWQSVVPWVGLGLLALGALLLVVAVLGDSEPGDRDDVAA
jgi:hypothetical protein